MLICLFFGFRYFPFYWLAKVIFLAWCFAPVPDNGSSRIYQKVLRPYFLKKRGAIDNTLNKVAQSIRSSQEKKSVPVDETKLD